ncbi:Glycogenin-2 [Cladochytrium tenue]|nr:Glycogenin-2 [Cladochytrium tenue]
MPTADDDTGANGTTPAPTPSVPYSDRVFVTLVTSDAYVPGALALAHSLRSHRRPSINSAEIPIVVLVTPTSLSSASSAALYRAFDRLVHVPTLRSGTAPGDAAGLRALARPELDITFTKLHVWDPDVLGRHVRAFAFLDADAFAVPDGPDPAALFDLLDRDDAHFAAAPDVGWPDAFNSGVFVGRPDRAVFDALLWHARHLGSFDGGDQGLLNAFFSSWAGHGRSPSGSVPPGVVVPAGVPPYPQVGPLRATRLPFSFNVTPSAAYSYLPWNLTRFADGTVMNQ